MNYSWSLQKFDTEHFGFRIAKITHIANNSSPKIITESIKKLLSEFKADKIQYATYRLNASDFTIIHALEEKSFIFVDGTIALKLNNAIPDRDSDKHIRKATINDIPVLRELAATVFDCTRFYTDPFISKEKANGLYASWVENSVKGATADRVLVWSENKIIEGFVTMQKIGHIPLIAVSKKAQGKGIAKKLIQATFNEFNTWKVKTIQIETQMTNIPALRSYQSCGFKITDSFLTLRWSSEKI